MSKLAVILFGPPAAGKGTQARMIATALRYPAISTGDILRAEAKAGTDLGEQARGYMESGGLVPDALVDAIVKSRLAREDCRLGFILDGYPRTVPQAEFLEASVLGRGVATMVIGIQVPDKVLVERVAGRMSCPGCGKIFNAASLPRDGSGRCDECGRTLVSRADDSAQVMEARLGVYHRETQPLIEHYRKRGWYIGVDGNRPVDEIQRAILDLIEKRQQSLGAATA